MNELDYSRNTILQISEGPRVHLCNFLAQYEYFNERSGGARTDFGL